MTDNGVQCCGVCCGGVLLVFLVVILAPILILNPILIVVAIAVLGLIAIIYARYHTETATPSASGIPNYYISQSQQGQQRQFQSEYWDPDSNRFIPSHVVHEEEVGSLDEEDVTRMAERWTDYETKPYDAIPEHKMQHEYRHVPRYVKQYVWNRDGGRCVECGTKENLEYDHIIPVAKGGSNTERNVQLLCEHCNRTKHAKIR